MGVSQAGAVGVTSPLQCDKDHGDTGASALIELEQAPRTREDAGRAQQHHGVGAVDAIFEEATQVGEVCSRGDRGEIEGR